MSNGDKRSVSTDALETLGTIIGPGERRDAIHLAVEPIVAGQTLAPGQDVGLIDGRAFITKPEHLLGIVDPFLKEPVRAGQRFWLVVYPRQIHSLRHVWTHPAFPDAPEVAGEAPKVHDQGIDAHRKQVSEQWLRDFCRNNDAPNYETLVKALKGEQISEDGDDDYTYSRIEDDYFHFGGFDAHCEIPPEFWTHAEIVTGKQFAQKPEHFSCSC